MSNGQADIFLIIFRRKFPRNEVIAATQYGKSSTVAMALILRSQTFKENWGIVTGDMNKSQIIMNKLIQHAFDHPDLYSKLELDPNESLDRLRRQRSREHISWKDGGSIRTFTADARNRNRVKEALTGFGVQNIVEDEASLIPNDVQAMIMRMLGGYKDNFLLKIGNPWQPNPHHFYKTWQSHKYHHLFIDYRRALAEGRYTPEFIEEMREMPFFDVLYECRFPEEDAVLEGGYRKVITSQEIERAFVPPTINIVQVAEGRARLGVDVGRGGNRTVFCLRYDNVAKILERNRDKDLMANVGKIVQYMADYNIPPGNVFVDDVGVGGGITDRLHELGHEVTAIREGAKATDHDRFSNLRAELYWSAAQWVKQGGKLVQHEGFLQLGLINVKEDSSSKLKAEPKADLQKRGVESPDDADSFALTFGESSEFSPEDFAII